MTDALAAALADRYRVERELGAGGMATVYLAHDLRHDRPVAIKVLRPDLAVALGAERFLAEIKTTARLQHPHILPLLDSGSADGLLYYVMPYVEGESLRDRLAREKQLPIEDAVRIAREVADALGFAHGHGIVHRDIKPENILLQGGHALVADFGIALAVSAAGGPRLTQTGLSLGTPHYMSPEQAMGESAIDARSDLYALGAVTYEMLVGEPPFTGATVQAIVAKVMSERPTRPSTLRDTIPPHVESTVLTALAKLPADRFGTATAFTAALTGAVAPSQPAHAPAARPARLPWAAALATGALLFALGWFGRAAMTGEGPSPPTVRLAVALPPGVHIPPTEWHTIALSRDGTRMAYVTSRGIEIRALDSYQSVVIAGSDLRNPTFSPDGRSLAYVASGGIWRVSVDGGVATRITPDLAYHATWGDDGRIYTADLGPTGIRAFEPDSGTWRQLTHPDSAKGESYHLSPEFLPGGTLLFTATGPSGGWSSARVLAVNTAAPGPARLVLDQAGSARFIAPDHLAYLDARGQLVIRRFDPQSLDVSGSPVAIDSVLPTHFGAVAHFTASRTGTIAYLVGSLAGQNRLVEADLAGREQQLIASGVIAWAAPSPNGRSLIASSYDGAESHLWHYEAGAPPRRLTFASAEHETPFWSRDGSEFIYSREVLGGRREVVLQSLRNPDSVRILLSRPFHMHVLGWSQDRRWLLFMGFRGGVERIYIADLDRGGPDRVVAERAYSAALSPDGRTIAYCVTEDEMARLYTASFPDLGQRAQVTGGEACWPQFGHDSRDLFFTDAGGWSRIGTLHVTSRTRDGWGPPRPLFRLIGAGYSVGGSPPRVYHSAPDSTKALREIRLVTGWSAVSSASRPPVVRQ